MIRIAIQSKGRLNEDSLARLFIKGPKAIAKKVGEEAAEAIIVAADGNRDRFLYETADLAYHLLVLMEAMGVRPEDLERELALRHRG